MAGYSHPQYALSMSEYGIPRELPRSGGWILERSIPGTVDQDGMGCYPLFACQDWSKLADDIHGMEKKLVSLALVTDPFGEYTPETLTLMFDVCFLFKHHFVTDLSKPVHTVVRKRYQKYARRALEDLEIEHCTQPSKYLQDWIRLYQCLVARHAIRGMRTFSEKSFLTLLSMPGVEMFLARHNHEPVGADIWIIDRQVGYAHLSAISPLGYELRASYALYWTALNHYSRTLSWLCHGAGTGISGATDGLAVFKSGWATGTRPVYLCGKILDAARYERLTRSRQSSQTSYFPAYRAGEFI